MNARPRSTKLAIGFLVALGLSRVSAAYGTEPDLAEPPPAPLGSTGSGAANGAQRATALSVENHVMRAAALYKAGDYLEAASELSVAYTLQPQPVYLFNIAQAYRKALRARAALVMYRRFVDLAPTHQLSNEAEGYILDMEALAKSEEQNERVQKQLAQQQQELEQQHNHPIYKRAWFWGVMSGVVGAGVIAIGLGVGLSRRQTPTDGGFVVLSF